MANRVARAAPPILIHLTEDSQNLESILAERVLRATTPLGAVHRHDQLGPSQVAVSLSEIDLAEVHQLASRHGEFGLAFRRSWAQDCGGAPVWYLPRGSVVQQRLFDLVKQLAFRRDPNLEHFLWEFTPFIDYPKDSGFPGGTYDWRWEREWRVVGDLEFRHGDIVVVFAPAAQHGAIREAWGRAARTVPIPPLVDVAWSVDDQIVALRSAWPAAGPTSVAKTVAAAERGAAWRSPPREPPDDQAFADFPESERVLVDPDAEWFAEQVDPDLKLMRELEADEDFDLSSLVWFEAEVMDSAEHLADHDAEGPADPVDNDLALTQHLDEWEAWLETFERDDV